MDDIDQPVSKRFQTMPLDLIDTETLGLNTKKEWVYGNDSRAAFLEKREQYTANWRDLNSQSYQRQWENSSDFHLPLTLFYGKAIHARLWQIFSDENNFFGARARREAFESREEDVKDFMRFVLNDYANAKQGTRDVFDELLWDNVFDGSGIVKVYWQKDVFKYSEVVQTLQVNEKVIFDKENLTGRTDTTTKQIETEEDKTEIVETPYIKRILLEDYVTPVGQGDPQTADYVMHRVYMTEDQLKARANEGKFDKAVVEECLAHRIRIFSGGQDVQIKQERAYQEGYSDFEGYYQQYHSVVERYGKIYVKKDITGQEFNEIDEMPEECVVWIHVPTAKVLGWTYLHRISPSGIRPIFKFDFIKFPDRNHGVGVGEVMAPIQQAVNAVYNLRQDNGVLASTPFGFYRAASGLKPDKYKIEPGNLIPVDDPQNDVRIVQMPFLQGFGYQEEDRLIGYAERTLSISDLQLGASNQGKVGMFRTASGAAAVQSESGIQLEIHFDRIARTMSKMLQCLFRLCRERIPEDLYYRVTGKDGEPLFGKVDRDNLRGEYDFEINIDILSEGSIQQQQKATMMMQTLLNPAFMQTGIVSPTNLYELAQNFLMKNKVRTPGKYLTPPQNYQGPFITPEERIFRIVVGQFTNPPIASTVKLSDNHEQALETLQAFHDSDEFGLLKSPEQLNAFKSLIAAHTQMQQAQQAGGNPNMMGSQIPREGMPAMQAMAPGQQQSQGPLGAPPGEVNGPVR